MAENSYTNQEYNTRLNKPLSTLQNLYAQYEWLMTRNKKVPEELLAKIDANIIETITNTTNYLAGSHGRIDLPPLSYDQARLRVIDLNEQAKNDALALLSKDPDCGLVSSIDGVQQPWSYDKYPPFEGRC